MTHHPARFSQAEIVRAIRAIAQADGVIFVEENEGGADVRLRMALARGDPDASIPVEDLNAENDE